MERAQRSAPPPAASSAWPYLAVAAMLVGSGACTELRPATSTSANHSAYGFSQEQLGDAMEQFEDFLEETTKQAVAEILEARPDTNVRRAALLWKTRAIAACQRALKHDDPIRTFVDCWTLSARIRHYLADGDGKAIFGKQQPIAVAAAAKIEAEIERIGTLFLPADRLAKAREEVVAFARDRPIRGVFLDVIAREPSHTDPSAPGLLSIVNVPLAPFRAIEGIDRGAQAIRGFTDVASRFSDIVEEMPGTLRSELQLLLLDLEDNGVVRSFLASLEILACSAASAAATAEKLPERLRREAAVLLQEVDARQANLQHTLELAERTAVVVERALDRVDVVAESIGQTGVSVSAAGRAWGDAADAIGRTVQGIRHDRDPWEPPWMPSTTAPEPSTAAPPPPVAQPSPAATAPAEGSSFDINDYRKTADALTGTATEMRALAAEVRSLVESQRLTEQIRDIDARVQAALDRTAARTQGLADHLAWRGAQLAGLIFVLAIAYRIASARWLRRAA